MVFESLKRISLKHVTDINSNHKTITDTKYRDKNFQKTTHEYSSIKSKSVEIQNV